MNSGKKFRPCLGGVLFLAFLMLSGAKGDETLVTIKGRVPIQTLDATEHPIGVQMSIPDSEFILVKVKGTKLVVKDKDGNTFLVAAEVTNFVPAIDPTPLAVTTTPTTTNASSGTPVPMGVADTASSHPSSGTSGPVAPAPSLASDGSASSNDPDLIKQLNSTLGIQLVTDTHFWDDPIQDVGQRLRWPLESQTSTDISFRRYALPQGTPVLGVQAYSLALYGKKDKPTYLSIIFSNAGDFAEASSLDPQSPTTTDLEKVKKDLAVAVKQDTDTISDKLTALLGRATVTLYGNSSSNRDEVHRWDWKDIAFLLNSHGGEYVSLKIIPTTAADHFGTVAVEDDDVLKAELVQRVTKRDNGDVILTDVPMVDQGPKGYCVPATWERYLRYMDVPADLYVLAILGNTGLGGGTNIYALRQGVDDYVGAYHRRIEQFNETLDVDHIAKYIDQGLPLMWTCFCTDLSEKEINIHSQKRARVSDWPSYVTEAAADDANREKKEPVAKNDLKPNGHMRMIIGYNSTTDEIAISDSWGDQFAERWMTIKEANDTTAGDLEYIRW